MVVPLISRKNTTSMYPVSLFEQSVLFEVFLESFIYVKMNTSMGQD